jgi:hypothetical protein
MTRTGLPAEGEDAVRLAAGPQLAADVAAAHADAEEMDRVRHYAGPAPGQSGQLLPTSPS